MQSPGDLHGVTEQQICVTWVTQETSSPVYVNKAPDRAKGQGKIILWMTTALFLPLLLTLPE